MFAWCHGIWQPSAESSRFDPGSCRVLSARGKRFWLARPSRSGPPAEAIPTEEVAPWPGHYQKIALTLFGVRRQCDSAPCPRLSVLSNGLSNCCKRQALGGDRGLARVGPSDAFYRTSPSSTDRRTARCPHPVRAKEMLWTLHLAQLIARPKSGSSPAWGRPAPERR